MGSSLPDLHRPVALVLGTCCGCFVLRTPPPRWHFWFREREGGGGMLNPLSQALRGYDYLSLSRITFPLYQALWQTRHNQTVAMATRTSFGVSQSPEWQDIVLLLATVPQPGFLRRHPERQDSGHPPLPPDLLLRQASSGAASFLLYFIAFCHYLKKKDSRISPNFPPLGRGYQPEGTES